MASFARLIRKTGDLERLSAKNKVKWKAAFKESMEDVAKPVAIQLAPVSEISTPGYVHMRDTIFVRQEGDFRWYLGATKAYTKFVEEGTIHMEKQPFIGPALVLARRHLRSLLANR